MGALIHTQVLGDIIMANNLLKQNLSNTEGRKFNEMRLQASES